MKKITIALLAVLVSACGHMEQKAFSNDDLQGRWTIANINGNTVVGERSAWVEFKNDRLAANAGCNSLMGKYQFSKQSIEFTQMAGTQMYCQETMEQEGQFLALLNKKLKTQFDGNTLYLLEDKKAVLTLQKN